MKFGYSLPMTTAFSTPLFFPTLGTSYSKNYGGRCIAVSSSDAPLNKLDLSLAVGSRLLPHPEKASKGGEDALIVSSLRGGFIAVADGVSGWAEEDVDPAIFPKELMANISLALQDKEIINDPRLLMQRAHEATRSVGSATLIIAMLERCGMLKIANVGDCGLRVLRQGRIIFSTSPQEHYFDCPYQLSSTDSGQTFEDALLYDVELSCGDIVVMGSDGLFDNVFDHEIETIVRSFGHTNSEDSQKIVDALVDLASLHARDPSFESPYCLEARVQGYDVPLWKKLLGLKFMGGKLDDITAAVGIVTNTLIPIEEMDNVASTTDTSVYLSAHKNSYSHHSKSS